MKTLIMTCLFDALFCAIFIHAQNLPWRNGKVTKTDSIRAYRNREGAMYRSSENKSLEMKDYLRRWLNPPELLDELSPLGMSFRERIRSGNNKKAFYHSTYSPQTVEAQSLSNGVQEAWVRHFASGLVPAFDIATDIVVDGSGNVYVTGTSYRTLTGYDYATIKYNSFGVEQWITRYDGPGNASDSATAIAVDGAGNIYVTGKSSGSGTSFDYTTIKYNSSGVEQWVVSYNGLGNRNDIATSIFIDSTGYVYVTGGSVGSDAFFEYATIKYSSSGAKLWEAHYNGPGNSNEQATDLFVDNSGNVYVTGWGGGTASDRDYVTIKYNASGVERWVTRYNSEGNYSTDIPNAMTVDNSGNVYVTGSSNGSSPFSDFATIKYDSNGIEQWVARYDGIANRWDNAVDIVIDGTGNVYVTGPSVVFDSPRTFTAYYDYATIKYNPSGAVEWIVRYNGPADDSDYATDLAIDGSGNIYVTGRSEGSPGYFDYATVKYNSSGIQEWAARYTSQSRYSAYASALAIDDSGNVYVTGASDIKATSSDYATVKYNSSGQQGWASIYEGPGNSDDHPTAAAIDATDNVYITGWNGTGTSTSSTTVKYNPYGDLKWAVRRNRETAGDLTIDGFNNIYVTGGSETIKYDKDGIQEWLIPQGGSHLTVDASGNIYVTGSSYDSRTDNDYLTVKFNSSGIQEWFARYNGPGSSEDRPNAIVVDVAGNVYVTGFSMGSGTFFDYATIKYNSSGIEQWVARYNGPGNNWDEPYGLAVDGSGNVYVTGDSKSSTSDSSCDYATIKYNSSGVEQWVVRYNGPGNLNDFAWSLAVDAFDNVYVTGSSVGSGTSADYATIKYNFAGTQQWIARYDGLNNSADNATALTLDSSGNIYVTGYAGFFPDYDCITIKYNPSGIQEWLTRYAGPKNSYDHPIAIALDGSNNVYVVDWSESFDVRGLTIDSRWSVYTTIKYIQTTVSVEDKEHYRPNFYWLSQNYPNPFNPFTTFRYAIAKPGQVTLKVFNLQGKEVVTLVNERKTVGEYEIQWNPTNLPSGVYFYRLQAGGFMQTKKLTVLK